MKFNVYVDDNKLKDVNINSLLLDSGTVICDLIVGNIKASLEVKGEIKIYNKHYQDTNDFYKNYNQFPKELKDLIRSGYNAFDLEQKGYYIEDSNWVELFIDNLDTNDEICDDVIDIDGELNENNLIGSLFQEMVYLLYNYTNKNDYDIMKLNGTDEELIKNNIVGAYPSYSKLAEIKNGIADEEFGRKLYMESNHNIVWTDIEENSMEMLVELKKGSEK